MLDKMNETEPQKQEYAARWRTTPDVTTGLAPNDPLISWQSTVCRQSGEQLVLDVRR